VPSIERPGMDQPRFNMLVWGDSGCGKTTLASTAPGEKLWIQFDPQGVTSIANRSDVHLLELSGSTPNSIVIEFNKTDPFGIAAFLKDKPQVETVVIDSVTALSQIALAYAVTRAGGNSNIDVPGMNGYGTRNNVMRRVVIAIMQICAANSRHMIMTTHEGAPDKDDKAGTVLSVTMSLSSNLANDVAMRFNEVWFMKDHGNARRVYVRPWGVYKPMKTRMFSASSGASAFDWKYDADTLSGDGIAEWWSQWCNNGGKKINLPGGKK